MKTKLLFLFLFFIIIKNGYTQVQKDTAAIVDVKPSVQVIARSYGDSVVLRWAPTLSAAWTWGNKYGYMVERFTLVKNGQFQESAKREGKIISNGAVKPLPLLSWEGIVKREPNAAIYAQALYGEEFLPKQGEKMDIISMANRAEQIETRYSFALFVADQSIDVAEVAGLKFTDKKTIKGEKYLYRVYPALQPKSYRIDTGSVFVAVDERTILPKPSGLGADFTDKSVNLHWSTRYYSDIFISYIIERSDDNGKTFKSIDNLPFINVTPETKNYPSDYIYRLDSLPENDKLYIYRVKGKTSFGEISPPSDTVQGMGIETILAVEPVLNFVKPLMNGSVEIRWLYPDSLIKNIQGFVVARASMAAPKSYKDISKILSNTARSYEDTKPDKENYYVVKAVDINGKVALSFPIMGLLKDSVPPLPPTGLFAKVDSSGIVKIRWKKNKEEDMLGYRVYMSNSLREEFMFLSKGTVMDTNYTDTITLNTLTKKAYYKLVAIDQHFNPSDFSQPIELKRPDIVPPSAPAFDKLESLSEGIKISWKPSTSNDVVAHVLYRRIAGEKKWVTIAVVDSSKKVRDYYDKSVEKRKSYEYTILAVDDSKLESDLASPIEIAFIDDGKRPDISRFRATLEREKKIIELKWDYELKNVKRFLIYRIENGSEIRLYKSVEGNQFVFMDKSLLPNTTYQYRVKAVLIDGSQSDFSKEIAIVY